MRRGAECKGYARPELARGAVVGGRATGGKAERVGAGLSCGTGFLLFLRLMVVSRGTDCSLTSIQFPIRMATY